MDEVFLEVFVDFPLYRKTNKPDRLTEITPKQYPLKISEEQIKEAFENLRKKYANKGYRIVTAEINGSKCLGITRKDGIPVFFDVKRGRVYVRERDVINNPEWTAVIVHYRLTALKIPLRTKRIRIEELDV